MATYKAYTLVVIVAILAFSIGGCGDNYGPPPSVGQQTAQYPPKRDAQNQQTESDKTDIPSDLSTFRGNLQRTGVFANGGTPSLQGQLWQRSQRDLVDSAPIMAGDMLIFTVAGEGLYGADAKTGDMKWLKQGKIHDRREPTYQNGTLYYWWLDGLHAMDMKTQQEEWVFTGTTQPQFYSDAVPASTIYFDDGGLLQAIDRSTGHPRWTAKFAEGITYNRDIALNDNIVYFTAEYDRTPPGSDALAAQVNLYAADAQTGQELWKFEPKGNQETPGSVEAPIVGDGAVYCVTSYDAWLGPGRAYAFDGKTGAKLWEQPIDNLTDPELLAYSGGLLYVVTDGSSDPGTSATLRALDAKTGQEKWSFVKGDYMSAPTISAQTLYITAGNNHDHKGDTLYALDSSTGKLLREVQLTGAVTHPIVIDRSTIYYVSQNGDILADWVAAIR